MADLAITTVLITAGVLVAFYAIGYTVAVLVDVIMWLLETHKKGGRHEK